MSPARWFHPSRFGSRSGIDMSMTNTPGGQIVAVVPPLPGRGRRRRLDSEAVTGLLYVSPFIVGFVLFSALPMLASFVLSLTDFDPREPDEIRFIGLGNYTRLLSDPIVAESLWVTLRFALMVVP